jgi:hypothetical protein
MRGRAELHMSNVRDIYYHLHSLDIAQPWLPHNVGLWREIAGGPS